MWLDLLYTEGSTEAQLNSLFTLMIFRNCSVLLLNALSVLSLVQYSIRTICIYASVGRINTHNEYSYIMAHVHRSMLTSMEDRHRYIHMFKTSNIKKQICTVHTHTRLHSYIHVHINTRRHKFICRHDTFMQWEWCMDSQRGLCRLHRAQMTGISDIWRSRLKFQEFVQ